MSGRCTTTVRVPPVTSLDTTVNEEEEREEEGAWVVEGVVTFAFHGESTIPGAWSPSCRSVTTPWPSTIMAYVPFIVDAPNPAPNHTPAGPVMLIRAVPPATVTASPAAACSPA